jgi:hypothetical protein
MGHPARRLTKRQKRCEAELDDHLGSEVAEEGLRDHTEEASGSTAFDAGRAAARIRRGRQRLERRWQRHGEVPASPQHHR